MTKPNATNNAPQKQKKITGEGFLPLSPAGVTVLTGDNPAPKTIREIAKALDKNLTN